MPWSLACQAHSDPAVPASSSASGTQAIMRTGKKMTMSQSRSAYRANAKR